MTKKTTQKISANEVEHIAKLARIELNEADKKNFSNQLTDILGYVNKLNKVDTTNVQPTAHVTQLKDIMRRDEVKSSKGSVNLIKAAPENKAGCVKVKKVLK